MDVNKLLRPHLHNFQPYRSARDETKWQKDTVFLDANENALRRPPNDNLNRYPDPLQRELKAIISADSGLKAENIFLGNGSDEAIDLLIRAFCEPATDKILIMPPTYGMYAVSAAVNNVPVCQVPLQSNFQMDPEAIRKTIQTDSAVKLIFICSPNNPTGNRLADNDIETLLKDFGGLVILDEAYIDFAEQPSWKTRLAEFPNLVILQTLSKARGLAGARLGMAFARRDIIDALNSIKPPYNISALSQKAALAAFRQKKRLGQMITTIKSEREKLSRFLQSLSFVEKVYPSEANFILVALPDAEAVQRYLLKQNIVVRNRSAIPHCPSCLRITVGNPQENERLMQVLSELESRK